MGISALLIIDMDEIQTIFVYVSKSMSWKLV